MTEIEKLYKLAGIKKQYCGWLDMGDLDTQYTYVRCDSLEEFNDTAMMSRTSYSSEEEDWDKPFIEYPPFTAEKQIELIKWLSQHTYRNYIKFRFDICGLWYCECNMSNSDMHHTFEEALAELINSLWQDLTEQEKEEIRNILNENS